MVEIPQTCYDEYENFVSETVNSKDLLNFKSNNHYTYMLEHVSKEQGLEYLNVLQEILTFEEIIAFCF